MGLTPVEIRHIKPGRSLLGYNRRVVDELMDDVVDSFEVVWRERADLADKVERLEEDLVRYRELETLLRTTLVSAERASQELQRAGSPRGARAARGGACRVAAHQARRARRSRAHAHRVRPRPLAALGGADDAGADAATRREGGQSRLGLSYGA